MHTVQATLLATPRSFLSPSYQVRFTSLSCCQQRPCHVLDQHYKTVRKIRANIRIPKHHKINQTAPGTLGHVGPNYSQKQLEFILCFGRHLEPCGHNLYASVPRTRSSPAAPLHTHGSKEQAAKLQRWHRDLERVDTDVASPSSQKDGVSHPPQRHFSPQSSSQPHCLISFLCQETTYNLLTYATWSSTKKPNLLHFRGRELPWPKA